jgi:uncharacterized phage protein gp47/JayE
MAFQIKNVTSITGAMINHVRGVASALTDFNIGAIIRTMLEAVGIEIDELYQQIFNGLKEAIPEATYRSFSFDRLLAIPTSGQLNLVITSSAADVLIVSGTLVTTTASSTQYLTQGDLLIHAGTTTGVLSVVATTPGVGGNVAAGSPFTLTPAPANFVSASNPIIFNSGQDLETDDQRKQRFISYVQTLQRATIDALIYGAKTAALFNAAGVETERVQAVSVVEPYLADNTQPIAWCQVYVHNGVGSTSGPLVTRVATVLQGYIDPLTGLKVPGWKAAGVKIDVAAATETLQNVTGVITTAPGFVGSALITAANLAIEKFILSLDIGQTLKFKDLVILIGSIPGVANIVFSTPTADVTATASHKLMPGTLAITAV